MWFDVDYKSSIPIYQQLVQGVKSAIVKGIILPRERLPSVRELAVKVTINPNTIAKAYQELEREGVIETLQGRGTFVAAPKEVVNNNENKIKIKRMIEKLLIEAFHLQIQEEEITALIQDSIKELYGRRGGNNE